MPRPPRIEFEDALYHVTVRGVEKSDIALEDHDRIRWMEYLKQAITRFGLKFYAFVLMSNHFHLFLCTPRANLGKAMQYLNGAYAMYFNVRHKHSGHLFERRYHAVLVEDEGHYIELSRYIHLNPVRAGMVKRPENYIWSSYPGYHWDRILLPWLDYEQVLAEFGEGKDSRRRYREFVADGIGKKLEPPWKMAEGGWLLGSRKFAAKIYGMLASGRSDGRWDSRAGHYENTLDASLGEIASAVCKSYGISKQRLKAGGKNAIAARRAFIFISREKARASLKSVASYLGLGTDGAISNAAHRARVRAKVSREFRKQVSTIEANTRKLYSKGV